MKSSISIFLLAAFIFFANSAIAIQQRQYNDIYTREYLNHIAFPLGGIGAGMICVEGTGAISHVSVRNKPELFNEPMVFSALCIKDKKQNLAKVLEGPVPKWKYFGLPNTGRGSRGKTYGLPHFSDATFFARFPFAAINLSEANVPVKVEITAWSPFTPPEPNDSSLPMAVMEYKFVNTTDKPIQAVYSFNAKNFMSTGDGNDLILKMQNGFILSHKEIKGKPWLKGDFAAFVDDDNAKVDCAWLRSGYFDVLTTTWKNVAEGNCIEKPPIAEGRPSFGASIFVPVNLAANQEKTIRLMFCWYVPETDLRLCDPNYTITSPPNENLPERYKPWYAGKFKDIDEVTKYWKENYSHLRQVSTNFKNCFYDTTLPAEIIEAVSTNLSILKSPTILRQTDGRLWCWEGSGDNEGLGYGTCSHVWNYNQATAHLFPSLERTLRQTAFFDSQDENGHQTFRVALPIRQVSHEFHAAADGQLGGILTVYRDWRISGDNRWLAKIWPKVKDSLNYCIKAWDPDHNGVLSEPHHNTYDVELWGPDGMCSSYYLAALKATIEMGKQFNEKTDLHNELLSKGTKYVNENLFNGEYFYQQIQWKNLHTNDPVKVKNFAVIAVDYSPEAAALIPKEGPRYQYGDGCISDGLAGSWLGWACGINEILDKGKIKKHLESVYKYNFRNDLSGHATTQRPSFAMGNEGGLILCTWPKSDKPTLPIVCSDEIITGIEYEVASHMIINGITDKGLEIVRTCRDRYDGRLRNPFDEYEYGHWYGRALASYALLQSYTGARYDAIDKILYLKRQNDFRTFLSTETGYGTVGIKDGKAFVEVKSGTIDVKEIKVY